MGTPSIAAKSVRHERDDHGIEFDDTSDAVHDQGAVDSLARSEVQAEAKRTDEVHADKKGDQEQTANEAKGTPAGSPVAAPPNPELGKTVTIGGGLWTVTKYDSLWSIATQIYGKGSYWHEIKNANKSKVHGAANVIHDGDVLSLPKLDVPTLVAMKNFESQPEALRDLVCAMSKEEYEGFLAGTKPTELEKNAPMLQGIEMMRSTGMTFDEMADEQKDFLEHEAKKKGVSVGDYVKDLIAKKGYGGGTSAEYDKNSPKQKKAWHDRFKKVVAAIKSSAPADVKAIIKDSESKGGGFVWSPEETEQNGAFAYTNSGKWTLHCGTRFVEVGETDPSVCYANIAHEMGGHNYYGDIVGSGIQDAALDKLDPKEKEKALSGDNHMFSAYGYMETEIFAELYEFKYDSDKNPTDHPFDVDPKGNDMTKGKKRTSDVKLELTRIKEAFAPKVAEGLVKGLARRVAIDPRILPEAKTLFRADVMNVFGVVV